MKIQTILFPTDFSKCATDALEYSLGFIKSFQVSKVIVLHSIIYNDSAFIRSSEKEKENTQRYNEAKDKIDQVVRYINHNNPGVEVKEILDSGSPVETIDLIAEKEKVDLVMMGTKGATGLREVVIGSYAADVIKCAPCPVVVIPENYKYHSISKIVCTTELHASEFTSLKEFLDMVTLLHASIVFVNCDDNEQEQNAKLLKFQKEFSPDNLPSSVQFELLLSDDIVKSIESYVVKTKPDLVVTLGKRRDFWKRIFGEKVPEKLSFHTHIPLLSFHINDC